MADTRHQHQPNFSPTKRDVHLLLPDERAPKHADALANHRHLELVLLLEPVDNLLERRVILESEAVPERPLSVAILVLLGSDGL